MADKIMETMKEKIREMKIVPVVKLDDAKDALPLAKALVEGGLPLCGGDFSNRSGSRVY